MKLLLDESVPKRLALSFPESVRAGPEPSHTCGALSAGPIQYFEMRFATMNFCPGIKVAVVRHSFDERVAAIGPNRPETGTTRT